MKNYAELGWNVFPVHSADKGRCSCGKASCSSVGKHPRIGGWQKKATTNARTVRDWWARWPGSNIGIATGKGSGIFVLDVDDKNIIRVAEHSLTSKRGSGKQLR